MLSNQYIYPIDNSFPSALEAFDDDIWLLEDHASTIAPSYFENQITACKEPAFNPYDLNAYEQTYRIDNGPQEIAAIDHQKDNNTYSALLEAYDEQNMFVDQESDMFQRNLLHQA